MTNFPLHNILVWQYHKIKQLSNETKLNCDCTNNCKYLKHLGSIICLLHIKCLVSDTLQLLFILSFLF